MAGPNDLYPISGGKEISLRDEFGLTFNGSDIEVAKAQSCLIRAMRKDSTGKKIKCECVNKITHEPDKDRLCLICLGEGFKWDESFSQIYKVLKAPREVVNDPGLINVPLMLFYMRHNASITKDDKVIELVLDSDGLPVQPYQRRDVWRIYHLEQMRLDNGRLEYLRVHTFREDVKHLNG